MKSQIFFVIKIILIGLIFLLNACYRQTFNRPQNNSFNSQPTKAPFFNARCNESRESLICKLKRVDIQYEVYGDIQTLIIPTDRYYLFNSAKLNELCCSGLGLVLKLLSCYPESSIYVAAFTDEIGSVAHKKRLTTARAETMLTYLWANGISAKILNAKGYADRYAVSDNKIVHGSAQNRRVEIQWFKKPVEEVVMPYLGPTK